MALAVTLGLIAQGFGMPAMASSATSAMTSDCAMAHGKCPMPGTAKHLGMQPCQPPCVAPGTLSAPNVMAVPVIWARHRFAARADSIPPGLNPAPDPFPPRSPALA